MNIAIFGLGLIGGSLGRAILKNTAHKVYGYDICKDTLQKASMINAIHDTLDQESIKSVDMVVLALSPNIAIKTMCEVLPKLKDDAIVIDCCGNKRKIISAMEEQSLKFPKLNFVGTHPMAGKEFSGIAHSSALLFDNAYTILVPVHTPLHALSKVKQLFLDVGCRGIEIASAKMHDEMIAYTSQLAHIVSSSFVKSPKAECHAGFSAGSFKDMTRVAKLNPDMWAELLMENRDNLLNEIRVLKTNINDFENALQENDEVKLHSLLSDGVVKKEIADRVLKERTK